MTLPIRDLITFYEKEAFQCTKNLHEKRTEEEQLCQKDEKKIKSIINEPDYVEENYKFLSNDKNSSSIHKRSLHEMKMDLKIDEFSIDSTFKIVKKKNLNEYESVTSIIGEKEHIQM